MNSAPEISGRNLALIRLVAVTMLIWIVNEAFIAMNTGHMQADSSRIKYNLSGEHLWAGYLFLLTTAGICVLALFANYSKTHKFNIVGKSLGLSWFLSLSLAVWFSSAT